MSEDQRPETPPAPDRRGGGTDDDGLLDRVSLIESQPLAQRAAGFEQLHDELLAELQRSDQEGTDAHQSRRAHD